jgi:aspartate carbamoyltransferase catalytic subunit
MPAIPAITDRLFAFPEPHFLAAEDLDPPDIAALLDLADAFYEAEASRAPDLFQGRAVACIGPEAKAFEAPARRLGAIITDATPDLIIINHALSGAAMEMARTSPCSLINAGDGCNQAPVQAMGDMLALKRAFGGIDGLNIALLGDITYSPQARSNAITLSHMGAHMRLIGPATLIPGDAESWGCDIYHDLEDGLQNVDAILIQPVAAARLADALIPSWREYAHVFGLDLTRLSLAKPSARVMHAGPVRWGIELTPELADAPASLMAAQSQARDAMRLSVLASFAVRLEEGA